MQSDKYHGSCLCGAIKFSVTGFSTQVANCYCTMCRKFHGAAFGTLVSVHGLQWLAGRGFLTEFVASNSTKRVFCERCGSSIGFSSKGAADEDLELAISTFDVDIPVKVDAQIFTEYKANWCSLDKDIPSFDKARE